MEKRSPSHPSVSLPEALERAGEFYHAWGQNDASFEESLKQWGYTSRSNIGRKLVASMTSFGLLEKTGPNGTPPRLRINEGVLASLFDTSTVSDDRSVMILQMALKPDIYRRVWQRWGADLPDDARFRQYLVDELDFNPRAISRFARCYVDTIGLAQQHGLVPERNEKNIVPEFDDGDLLDNVSLVARYDDKEDTDLDFEEADESRGVQSQLCLVVDEDTDFEPKTEVDEEVLQPPREPADDDHIDFDFSSIGDDEVLPLPREPVDDDHIDFDFSSFEEDEPEVDNFFRLSRAFQVQALAAGGKVRELGRYSLRNDCKVAIYADGAIDREALEDLFTHLFADLVLGAFDTEDEDS